MAVRDLRLQRDSTKVHGVADSQISPSTPGVARFSVPMTFEPNVGRADSNVQFVGRGKGLTVLLTHQEIAVRVATPATAQNGTVVLRVAGNAGFDWKGEGRVRAESNYFLGNDPKKWHTGVPHFARAETADAAHGVGMAIYGNDDGVEYDLRVAPGGDVSKLRLTLTGAENLRVNASGDLLMNVAGDEVRMKNLGSIKLRIQAGTHPVRGIEGSGGAQSEEIFASSNAANTTH